MIADWLARTLVPLAIVAVVFLVLLWPTQSTGSRLLRAWGVEEPTEEQAAEAVRYLFQRRILYAALFILLPAVVDLVLPAGGLFVPLLAAMLVAELVATLRPVSGVRVASLDPRGWRDLLPRWAIGVGCGLTVLAAGTAVLAVTAMPREEDPWFVLGGVVLCVAAVGVLLHLAVRRPSSADEVVDAALRTRTARVAVAIGFGWLGTLSNRAHLELAGRYTPISRDWVDVTETVTMVALFGSVVAWIWLAVPSRRSLVRAG